MVGVKNGLTSCRIGIYCGWLYCATRLLMKSFEFRLWGAGTEKRVHKLAINGHDT
jgi:hypothetical protein